MYILKSGFYKLYPVFMYRQLRFLYLVPGLWCLHILTSKFRTPMWMKKLIRYEGVIRYVMNSDTNHSCNKSSLLLFENILSSPKISSPLLFTSPLWKNLTTLLSPIWKNIIHFVHLFTFSIGSKIKLKNGHNCRLQVTCII